MGDPGLIPGLGRSLGVGNSNPLQYSCLENSMDRPTPDSRLESSMDRGAWQATIPQGHKESGTTEQLTHTSEALHWEASPRTVAASAPVPVVGHCRHMPLQETLKHSQVGLAQSPVGSLLLSPGSWCMQDFVCALQESPFPLGLWMFYNQIPLACRVKFPGDSQSLGLIPRLGSLMWRLEHSQ